MASYSIAYGANYDDTAKTKPDAVRLAKRHASDNPGKLVRLTETKEQRGGPDRKTERWFRCTDGKVREVTE